MKTKEEIQELRNWCKNTNELCIVLAKESDKELSSWVDALDWTLS